MGWPSPTSNRLHTTTTRYEFDDLFLQHWIFGFLFTALRRLFASPAPHFSFVTAGRKGSGQDRTAGHRNHVSLRRTVAFWLLAFALGLLIPPEPAQLHSTPSRDSFLICIWLWFWSLRSIEDHVRRFHCPSLDRLYFHDGLDWILVRIVLPFVGSRRPQIGSYG